MTDRTAQTGVNLLKEILFDREAKRLEDLGQRLEAESEAARERHKALGDRLDAVFERAGTEQRLQHSVAGIIDGALREAEVERHDQLSRAIAPLVVHTIKVQLRDSQDEMVDALYPITGRLVKSYVQAEVSRMMAEINAKLGGAKPSAASVLTASEQALAEANKIEVEELFLVRRGSGDLIAHWERPDSSTSTDAQGRAGGANRDVLISGYISGIMTFAEEAFGADAGSFRALTLENGERIFVRGSAAHLLAVRCKGSAAQSVEHVIDEVFLDTLERYQKVLLDDSRRVRVANGAATAEQSRAAADVQKILPEVGVTIERLTKARRSAVQLQQAQASAGVRPSFTRLYVAAATLALPFVLWGLWSVYQSFETARTESGAQRILSSIDDVRGLPPRVDVERGGRALTISGFVSDSGLREQIIRRLGEEVPQAKVRDLLGVMPAGSGSAEMAIADLQQRLAAQQSTLLGGALRRAQANVDWLQSDVARMLQQARNEDQPRFRDLSRVLEQAAGSIRAAYAAVSDGARGDDKLDATLAAAMKGLVEAEGNIRDLEGAAPLSERGRSSPMSQSGPGLRLVTLANEVDVQAERLVALYGSQMQNLMLRPLPQQIGGIGERLQALSEKVDRLRPPSARDEFDALLRTSAVFFGNGTDIRDAVAAGALLDKIAERMKANPTFFLRVVGYTDERGTQLLNSTLAQTRADRLAGLLMERGVAANRVVAVGRQTAKDLARASGPDSANRRVEFELGFPGEAAGVP